MSNLPHSAKKPRGQILKEAREAQGITLEIVHEATKIPLDVLRAIEEGYTVRTLSAFYLKGFIKMYAQYLSVDVTDVLEDYHPEKLPQPIHDDPDFQHVRIKFEQFFTHRRQQQLLKIAGAVIVLFLIGRIAGCIRDRHAENSKAARAAGRDAGESAASARDDSSSDRSGPGESSSSAAARAPAGEPSASSRPQQPAVEAARPTPMPAMSGEVKQINLTVKAKQRGWLQVKVDDNLVFQSVLNKVVTETWAAEENIEISGNAIHTLDFELNGKFLGGLGRADRTAKRVVITKDGLVVKR